MATYSLTTNVAEESSAGYALSPITLDFTQFKLLPSAEGETIIGSIVAPLGLPNSFKFGAKNIKNIYANSGIDPGLYPPVRSGISVVCQRNETWTMKDATDASVPVFALPIQGHLVLKIPNNELITTADLTAFVNRLLGGLFDSKLNNLMSLIRGGTNMLL